MTLRLRQILTLLRLWRGRLILLSLRDLLERLARSPRHWLDIEVVDVIVVDYVCNILCWNLLWLLLEELARRNLFML